MVALSIVVDEKIYFFEFHLPKSCLTFFNCYLLNQAVHVIEEPLIISFFIYVFFHFGLFL